MSQIIINPYLDQQNQIFEEFAKEDNVRILDETNAKKHWETLQNMTMNFGMSAIDISIDSKLNNFRKSGWIEFRIFEDIELNAFAYREDNYQYLEMNFGTLYLIRDSFFTLFSTKEFLPEIGNSTEEITPIELFKENFETNSKTAKYFKYLPKCEIRQKCADLMSTLAIQFIYSHELKHLASCHNDYSQDKYGIKRFFEFKPTPGELAEAFDSRAMEIEADEGAMMFTLMYVKGMVNMGKYSSFEPYNPYLIWIYTMEILFKLMNPNESYFDDELDSHPNSFIRTFSIYELSILEAIEHKLIKDEKEAVSIFEESMKLQTSIFQKIGFLPFDKSTFEDNKTKMYSYRKRVVELNETELPPYIKLRKEFVEEEYQKLIKLRDAT